MHALGKTVYRFDGLEIDASRGCLSRDGREQHLRQQTFQVLLYLLEQHNRIVTKEELLHSIWHDTAVTDNALVQCIVDIRKALGDDSHQPRFIKTVPKVGYRFIGAVEEHPLDVGYAAPGPLASAEAVASRGDVGVPATSGSRSTKLAALNRLNRSPVGRASIAGVVILILGTAIYLALIARSGQPHAEITLPQVPGKKPLAVMYFENQSANAELDWLREGLADMLITDLARSNKLTVLSRQQLHLLLERTGRKPGDSIRLDDALDIAQRSHAEAVLLGGFATLGEKVRIDVQLYDTDNGELIAAERLVVDAPGKILTQLDLLSLKLMTDLGASPSELGKKAGLAEVMTNNLEAYRYYSLGLEKAQAFENSEAIRLLEKAIELDPKFAMAYARIGYAYAVTDFLPEKGRSYLEKAFQLSDRLTEKDKLYIAAWYAIAREDYPAALRTFSQIISQYPMEIEAYGRLSRLLCGEERVQESIDVIKQGLTLDPESKDLCNGLGMRYLALGKYDEAIAAVERYVALAPGEPNAYDSLGMCYQQSGQYGQAITQYQKGLELNPEFEPAIIHLGDVFFQQGKYHDAIEQYRRYVQVTRSDVARALGYGDVAYVYWRKGDLENAEHAANMEIRFEKAAVWNRLVIALDRKESATVERLREKLFDRLPYPQRGARHDLRSYYYFRGYLALKGGRIDEAIEDFKEALRHLPPTSGIYLFEDCLANAYLEVGRLDEAINEYHGILDLNPNYPLAHYHLGEAYKQKGDRDRARAEFERFLDAWKDADPEIPEVVNAKTTIAPPSQG